MNITTVYLVNLPRLLKNKNPEIFIKLNTFVLCGHIGTTHGPKLLTLMLNELHNLHPHHTALSNAGDSAKRGAVLNLQGKDKVFNFSSNSLINCLQNSNKLRKNLSPLMVF